MKRRFRAYSDERVVEAGRLELDKLNDHGFALKTALEEAKHALGPMDREKECNRALQALRFANLRSDILHQMRLAVYANQPTSGVPKAITDFVNEVDRRLQPGQGGRPKIYAALDTFKEVCVDPALRARPRTEVEEPEAEPLTPTTHSERVEAEKTRKAKKRAGAKAAGAAAKAELEKHRAEMRARNEAEVGAKPPMEHELEKPRKTKGKKSPKSAASAVCRVKIKTHPAGCVTVED